MKIIHNKLVYLPDVSERIRNLEYGREWQMVKMNVSWKSIPFKELYPFERSESYKWRATLLFGLFVFLFLWVFQPFGLNNPIPNKIWILLGYGIITSLGVYLGMFVLPLLNPHFFKEESWYLWKEMVYSMLIVLLIAFMNLAYSAWLGFFTFTAYNLFISFLMTFALGVFPVTASIFISYYNKLNKYSKEADHLSHSLDSKSNGKEQEKENITIYDYENKPVLEVEKDHLLRVESAQNYVEVYYLTRDEKVERILIRNTMKEIAQQLENIPTILRTHRSHIVNLRHIQSVKGNAQGLKLDIYALSNPVPVSRSYLRRFEQAFERM